MDSVDKIKRLEIANEILRIISRHGRKFFAHDGRVSQFHCDDRGRLWFTDKYSQKDVYTAYRGGRWRHFSEGGTLRSLVESLHDFITKGEKIGNHFGPWPEHLCGGDLWGYGESMAIVRSEIEQVLARKD